MRFDEEDEYEDDTTRKPQDVEIFGPNGQRLMAKHRTRQSDKPGEFVRNLGEFLSDHLVDHNSQTDGIHEHAGTLSWTLARQAA